MARRGPKAMTDAHKAALEQGRAEGRAVRDYLSGLREHKPKRGRKRTPETIAERLAVMEDQLATASPIEELHLVQERRDLTAELDALQKPTADLDQLEEQFVAVAKSYGERKGIDYQSWRAVGVSPATLKRAGINR